MTADHSIKPSAEVGRRRFSSGQAMISFFVLALIFLLAGAAPLRGQGTLRYTVADLPDNIPGDDLWEYTYNVSGFNFQTNQGFSVFFDQQLYKDLTNARPSGNPQWNMLVVQRDLGLNAPGYLDGQARVNGPTFEGPFQVAFVWLGVGAPGAQPFDIYDANFQTLFSGSSVVPEPASGLLVLVGGLMFFACRARRSCPAR